MDLWNLGGSRIPAQTVRFSILWLELQQCTDLYIASKCVEPGESALPNYYSNLFTGQWLSHQLLFIYSLYSCNHTQGVTGRDWITTVANHGLGRTSPHNIARHLGVVYNNSTECLESCVLRQGTLGASNCANGPPLAPFDLFSPRTTVLLSCRYCAVDREEPPFRRTWAALDHAIAGQHSRGDGLLERVGYQAKILLNNTGVGTNWMMCQWDSRATAETDSKPGFADHAVTLYLLRHRVWEVGANATPYMQINIQETAASTPLQPYNSPSNIEKPIWRNYQHAQVCLPFQLPHSSHRCIYCRPYLHG